MFTSNRLKELITNVRNFRNNINGHLVNKVSTFIEVDSLK